MDLALDERQMLLQAHAAGGEHELRSASMAELVRAADVAFNLQRLGLVLAYVRYEQGMPVCVHVTLTPKGRTAATA